MIYNPANTNKAFLERLYPEYRLGIWPELIAASCGTTRGAFNSNALCGDTAFKGDDGNVLCGGGRAPPHPSAPVLVPATATTTAIATAAISIFGPVTAVREFRSDTAAEHFEFLCEMVAFVMKQPLQRLSGHDMALLDPKLRAYTKERNLKPKVIIWDPICTFLVKIFFPYTSIPKHTRPFTPSYPTIPNHTQPYPTIYPIITNHTLAYPSISNCFTSCFGTR